MVAKNGSGNRFYVSGLEIDDLTAYGTPTVTGGGAVTLATDQVRTGARALKCAAGSAERALLPFTLWPTSVTHFFWRSYVYLTAHPTAARIITAHLSAAGSGTPELRLNADGTLSLMTGTSPSAPAAVYETGSTVIPLNTWTMIEMGHNTTVDQAAVRINGEIEFDWQDVVAQAATATVTLGVLDNTAQGGNGALTLWWDDFTVDALEWPGPGEVHRVGLNSTVLSTGWTPVVAANVLDAVDEIPFDDTTYDTGPASTAPIFFDLDTLPAGVVRGITGNMRARRNSAGVATSARLMVRTEFDATSLDATFTNQPLTASFAWYHQGISDSAIGHWNADRLDRSSFGVASASAAVLDLSNLAFEVDVDTSGDPKTYPSGRLLVDGAESGSDLGLTLTGTAAIVSSGQRSGDYAYRINPVGATISNILIPALLGPGAEYFFRVYCKVDAYPASGIVRLFALSSPSAQVLSVFVGSDGRIEVSGGDASAAGVMPLGEYKCVELRVCRSNANGSGSDVEARVDGVTVAEGSNLTQSAAIAFNFYLGSTVATNMAGVDIYFDDIAMSDTDWCGEGEVRRLVPNATTITGAATGDSGPSGGSSFHSMVDEIPPDDSTTYFDMGLTNNAGIFYELDFEDPPADVEFGEVRGVSIITLGRSAGAGATAWQQAIETNGRYEGATIAGVNFSTAAAYQRNAISASRTFFDGAWDADALTATKVRMRSADTVDNPRITSVVLSYELEPGESSAPPQAVWIG